MIRNLSVLLLAVTLMPACMGGSSGGGSKGGSGGSGGAAHPGGSGGGNAGGGGETCDDTDPGDSACRDAEACKVECICENGRVTTGSCVSQACASAEDVCPDACDSFEDNGEWTDDFCFVGTEGGGGEGGAGGGAGPGGQGGSGGGTSGAPILTECSEGYECASNWCVISDDAQDRWYCSIECATDFDCPSEGEWTCTRRNHTDDNRPYNFCVADDA